MKYFNRNGRKYKAEPTVPSGFYNLYERRAGIWIYYATVNRRGLEKEFGNG